MVIKNWNSCRRKKNNWTDLLGVKNFKTGVRFNGFFDKGTYKKHLNFIRLHSDYPINNNDLAHWTKNIEKYKNKKILIIGAGPSTNLIKDSDIETTDSIWSCNHFFLNKKIRNYKPELIFIGNEVNLENEKLTSFLENVKPDIIVSNVVSKEKDIKKIVDIKKNNNVGFFYPKWVGKSGEGPKMILLAACLGASEISFIGIDGHTKEEFEKKISGSVFEKNKILKKKTYDWDLQRIQYPVLFGLLKDEFPETIFKNLGSRYENNQIKFLNESGVFHE